MKFIKGYRKVIKRGRREGGERGIFTCYGVSGVPKSFPACSGEGGGSL